MASYIIHTIAGELLLKEIENRYQKTLNNDNKNKFLLGNLIVDSLKVDMTIPYDLKDKSLLEYKMDLKRKIRQEKITTHFRNIDNEENILKIPEPELFINKYKELIQKDISALGYLFHLYTDKYFFSNLFPKTFKSLKENGDIATKEKESHSIYIIKSKKIISDKEFWTGTTELSIYSDYTILNKLLLEFFGTNFDSKKLIEYAKNKFDNPGIEEVDYSKIIEIILKTQKFIEESYQLKQIELKVFDEEYVKEFIYEVVKSFLQNYENLLEPYLSIKQIQLKKEN